MTRARGPISRLASVFLPCSGIQGKMLATQSLETVEPARPLSAEELCRSYAPSVCRFAALMSRSTDDAEDLAQEALMRAVRSLRSYDANRGSIESWLWRIVANAAKDRAGARQRFRDMITRLGFGSVDESETVEDAALSRLRNQELHAQLLRLQLRDRTLIVLRYCLDLDLEHVGAAVGLSAESAGRATRRALARLRAQLKEFQT